MTGSPDSFPWIILFTRPTPTLGQATRKASVPFKISDFFLSSNSPYTKEKTRFTHLFLHPSFPFGVEVCIGFPCPSYLKPNSKQEPQSLSLCVSGNVILVSCVDSI